MPYGARLQYLIHTGRPRRELVACVQFSSPAWRIKVRDQWIGWDDSTRSKRLQHVVNNSRFLILARIKNLASMALSRALQHLSVDWFERYGLEPLLVETLVDRQRFLGVAIWLPTGNCLVIPVAGAVRIELANVMAQQLKRCWSFPWSRTL
nr:Druantia anti-phage system protein DruA [Desulfonatronospira thiodismutans]